MTITILRPGTRILTPRQDMRIVTPMGGAAFVGAYDAFAASIVHAYEPARRVLTAYTGNLVRLRRATDDAESDFGYDALGNLDTAAITAWLSGAAGNVVTVYDQKGGDNITQTTKTAQPTYAASAQNGHAGMSFDGANHWLAGAFTTGGALSQPYHLFGVAQLSAAGAADGNWHLFCGSHLSGTTYSFIGKRTNRNWEIYAGIDLEGGACNANWLVWSVLMSGAASQLWHNGTSQILGNAGPRNISGLSLGSAYSGNFKWIGFVTALVICDPNLDDANRIAMQNAMNAYWGCY